MELHLTSSPFSRISDIIMLTNFYSKFLKAGSLHAYSSSFSSISLKPGSGFLKGGTNFLRTDVPFGNTFADMNSPAGTTILATFGRSEVFKQCYSCFFDSKGLVRGVFNLFSTFSSTFGYL